MNSLSISQLSVYGFLTIPTLYNLFRHGKHGLLGWIYLFIFCILRISGSAMEIKDSISTGAAIVANIGLSPLLLASVGFLHEARYCCHPKKNHKLETIPVLSLHILAAGAIGIVATGASALTSGTSSTSDLTLLRVGMCMLLLTWVLLLLLAVFSLLPSQRKREAPGYKDGLQILYAVLLAIPFIGIRMLYGVVSVVVRSAAVNPVTGRLALRLCLSVLPELIAVVIFILVGLMTRGVVPSVGENK